MNNLETESVFSQFGIQVVKRNKAPEKTKNSHRERAACHLGDGDPSPYKPCALSKYIASLVKIKGLQEVFA